jgi:hypothetical protein
MEIRHPYWWLPFLATCAVASAAGPRPAARVLEVSGTVTAAREGGLSRSVAAFGTLYAAEQLSGGPQSSLVIAIRHDGHLETLRGPFAVQVTERGCVPEERVQRGTAARDERVLREVVQGVFPVTVPGAGLVRSHPGDELGRLLSPALRPVVLSPQPQFAWRPGAAGSSYELVVTHDDRPVWSGTTAKNVLVYGGEQRLQGGARYDWTLSERHKGGRTETIGEGQFKVATPAQMDIGNRIAEWVTDGDIAHVCLAALWYKQQDMVLEALAAAYRLTQLAPKQPGFRYLLDEMLERAGWREEDLPALKPPAGRTVPAAGGQSGPTAPSRTPQQ